jgi:hypothetical protein
MCRERVSKGIAEYLATVMHAVDNMKKSRDWIHALYALKLAKSTLERPFQQHNKCALFTFAAQLMSSPG